MLKKILFCGFGELGVLCLERLLQEGYCIKYALTHKDMGEGSLDAFLVRQNIEFSYADTRKNPDYFRYLFQGMELDCLISINYRYIIPPEIFRIPKHAINLHGSLLPKYRGRTPHVWSIINGEEYAGITSHLIEEGVDTGDIIEQIEVKIEPEDTGYTLLQKFKNLYPELLIRSLIHLEENRPCRKQDERMASYFGKRTPDMGYIDFHKSARQVINFVRAQARPYPGAYYY